MPGSLGLLGCAGAGRGGDTTYCDKPNSVGHEPPLSYPAQRLEKDLIFTGNKETGAGRTKALRNVWSNRSDPVASRRRPVEINLNSPTN